MTMKSESKLFTKAELEEIKRQQSGDYSDKMGLFSARIKPKIIEILEWFSRKKELKKLVEPKRPARKDGGE